MSILCPDLMLPDIRMPRLDGFAVLDWLRKQPGLKRHEPKCGGRSRRGKGPFQ
jgi:CheY-like chemotaxis protein